MPENAEQLACPDCDLLMDAPAENERLRCVRCHKIIVRPARNMAVLLAALSVIGLLLVVAVCFFPFLSVRKIGLGNSASLFDAIFVFTGEQLLLAITVAALILVIPAVRTGLLLFALLPAMQMKKSSLRIATSFRPCTAWLMESRHPF